MKTLTLALGLTLIATTGAALAEMHDMSQHQMALQPAAQTRHEGHGIVKAVNEKAHKVQIAHEAIADLHWPAMTMWFVLRDPVPQDVHVGDAVRFELEQAESNRWIVTHMERK